MAVAHFQIGEHQEAAERAADAVALRPNSYFSQCILACSLAMLGRLDEARLAAAELRRVLPQPHALDRFFARFIGPGDRERLPKDCAGPAGRCLLTPPASPCLHSARPSPANGLVRRSIPIGEPRPVAAQIRHIVTPGAAHQ